MKKLSYFIIMFMLLCISSFAGSIKVLDDKELSEISAQGFSLNYQVMDDAIKSSLAFPNYTATNLSGGNPNLFKYSGMPTNLVDSLMISGFAQKDAFVPINAVNSSVNVPINIVFVMNSKITGGININNQLQSALKPF